MKKLFLVIVTVLCINAVHSQSNIQNGKYVFPDRGSK